MRKLIAQQWVTLDDIVAEEDGGLGFVTPLPFDDAHPTPFQDRIMAMIDSVDTLILGADTYRQSTGWADATDQGEYGRKLNELTKYVASTTLDEAPWGAFPAATVTADPLATVRELKDQDGKNLWLWGSLTLMQSLFEAGLIDEVLLLVCPTTRGRGRRFFQDRRDLVLREATGFDHGVVLLRYEVKN
ncbi:Dihydrofolate reductase [Microbacterium sp. 8M]|jgi:dihydrofolate reductase|uniref:dihydrofolate reductase family protein n=1 Tax=Microbacterium sp. 8M TaxID=2653153 RepID=UPI0012EF10D0|nr:dihydrofolate reductase family protein [Microbacterium sp. 8M]VXB25018.1 Dihydrofolate reductase [Microbacterium sp. 8M]